jgi:P-type Cu2+ transporter
MAEALTGPAQKERSGGAAPQGGLRATTLVVENMHCGQCMRSVEAALGHVAGVTSARVNLSARRVTVTRQAANDNCEDLIDALAKAGFKAAELPDRPDAAAIAQDRDFLRRVGVAGFAAANIMLLSISVWSGAAGDMDRSVATLFHWLSALIALPAIAYAGQPFFRSACRALLARRLNMDVPISLGVLLATAMSLYQTVRESEQVYFDAAIALVFFLLLGRFLDQRMRARVAAAAGNLVSLRATAATVLNGDGTTERVPARALAAGMRILVAAGERIAVDGRVIDGASEIDDSLITGESRPHPVGSETMVFAGTVNLGAPLLIEATATDENTLLAEIARLVSAAQQARGLYVRLADRAARLYAPAVHLVGLSTFLGWMIAGHGWDEAMTVAIAVLIITCPCALALAVPAVQVAATGRLFGRGVLVKAADGLERLAEADTVVFDKTGTLSLGEPRLLANPMIDDHTLICAASLALASRHPYARALVKAAREQGLNVSGAIGTRETAGSGLSRITPEGEERLGSAHWCGLSDAGGESATLFYRPPHGKAVPFQFQDRLRPDAHAVIARLGRAGFAVELLSGDSTAAVAAAAAKTGIAQWQARLDPAGKIARLETLKAAGRKVIMVGDGLNDAPALAAAHASISPSTAADVSQTAADAIFQGENLSAVIETIAVSKAARRLALQNFAIAVGYNAIFVPLAVMGFVTPLLAAIAMSTSSLLVTANAVRLTKSRVEL